MTKKQNQQTKAPGIILEDVSLLMVTIGPLTETMPTESVKYRFGLIDFSRNEPEHGVKMTIGATFDLFKGIKGSPLLFQFAMAALYKREGENSMPFDDLEDHVLLAHIIPFVREFVANMTSKLPGHNQLLLPLINTKGLLDEWKKGQSPKS